MSDEANDGQSRLQREITAKAVAAAKAVILREFAAIEQAARDGTFEKYLQDRSERGKDPDCN